MWHLLIRTPCHSERSREIFKITARDGSTLLEMTVRVAVSNLREISCVNRSSIPHSRRNEHISAFDTLRPRHHCDTRLRGIFLDIASKCLAAVTRAGSCRCKSRRSHVRGYTDCEWQLRSCCAAAIDQRTCSLKLFFPNFGVNPMLGSIAISWRKHF